MIIIKKLISFNSLNFAEVPEKNEGVRKANNMLFFSLALSDLGMITAEVRYLQQQIYIHVILLLTFNRETWSKKTHRWFPVFSLLVSGILTQRQGQIEYRSRIENWRILQVTSPGDSTALSQCSYIWPTELRNLHSQTFILEMLHRGRGYARE